MYVLLTELPALPLLLLFLLFSTLDRVFGSAAAPTYWGCNVPKARNVPTGEQMLRGRAVRLVQKPAPKTWTLQDGSRRTQKRILKAQGSNVGALLRRTGQDFQSPWRFCRTELLRLFIPGARLRNVSRNAIDF